MKRRTALKWSAPVITLVVLPSHATLSDAPEATTTPKATTTIKSTTTPNPTTTQCAVKRYRLKASAGLGWEVGVGRNDCIKTNDYGVLGSAFGTLSGNEQRIVFTLTKPGFRIVQAAHKAGLECFGASIKGDTAVFTKGRKDISHIEIIIEGCA